MGDLCREIPQGWKLLVASFSLIYIYQIVRISVVPLQVFYDYTIISELLCPSPTMSNNSSVIHGITQYTDNTSDDTWIIQVYYTCNTSLNIRDNTLVYTNNTRNNARTPITRVMYRGSHG